MYPKIQVVIITVINPITESERLTSFTGIAARFIPWKKLFTNPTKRSLAYKMPKRQRIETSPLIKADAFAKAILFILSRV